TRSRTSSAGLYFEVELVACRGGDALALRHRDAGDPDDFFAVRNHRQAVTEMSRNMGVDEDVLEPFGRPQAERPHPVAGLSGGHQQGQLDEVAVEVTDLVAGLERRGITGAGRDRELRGRSRLSCGVRLRLAATEGFHLEKARVGDQSADDT